MIGFYDVFGDYTMTEKGILEIYKDMIHKLLQGERFSLTRKKKGAVISDRTWVGWRSWGSGEQHPREGERERRKLG